VKFEVVGSRAEAFGIIVKSRDQRPQLLEAVVSMHIAEPAGQALEMGDGATGLWVKTQWQSPCSSVPAII
jgi:hypothetical protein